MLKVLSQPNTDVVHGFGDGDRLGERIPSEAQSGKPRNTDAEHEAGTSRFRGGRGGRDEVGGSGSDFD